MVSRHTASTGGWREPLAPGSSEPHWWTAAAIGRCAPSALGTEEVCLRGNDPGSSPDHLRKVDSSGQRGGLIPCFSEFSRSNESVISDGDCRAYDMYGQGKVCFIT